jgi:hypothetical protein
MPAPREPRAVDPAVRLCRLPGCKERHSGPRYDLFCREHYAKLNAEERAKYKATWKAAQA